MRGQVSRHRRKLPSRPAAPAGANGSLSSHDWKILHDLSADDPITDEELAVIEAFLMPEIMALLQQESSSPDSKEPQRFHMPDRRIKATDDRP